MAERIDPSHVAELVGGTSSMWVLISESRTCIPLLSTRSKNGTKFASSCAVGCGHRKPPTAGRMHVGSVKPWSSFVESLVSKVYVIVFTPRLCMTSSCSPTSAATVVPMTGSSESNCCSVCPDQYSAGHPRRSNDTKRPRIGKLDGAMLNRAVPEPPPLE